MNPFLILDESHALPGRGAASFRAAAAWVRLSLVAYTFLQRPVSFTGQPPSTVSTLLLCFSLSRFPRPFPRVVVIVLPAPPFSSSPLSPHSSRLPLPSSPTAPSGGGPARRRGGGSDSFRAWERADNVRRLQPAPWTLPLPRVRERGGRVVGPADLAAGVRGARPAEEAGGCRGRTQRCEQSRRAGRIRSHTEGGVGRRGR